MTVTRVQGLNTWFPHYDSMTLDWAERERLVIEMLKKGIAPKQIAHELKMSLRDVYKVRDKYVGTHKEKELTTEHQAIMLFDAGKKPAQVAVELRITLDECTRHYVKYMDSYHLWKFGKDYERLKGYMNELSEMCYVMKKGGLKVKELVDEYHLARNLAEMEERQLEIMKGNNRLKMENYDLSAGNSTLRAEKADLEAQINTLKPEVEELERRYSLTYDFLKNQNPNVGSNYYQNYRR